MIKRIAARRSKKKALSAMQQELFDIDNPCIQVCEMNRKGYCIGCLRNRTERELWYKMTNEQKRDVLRLLTARRLKLQRAKLSSAKENEVLSDDKSAPFYDNLPLFD